jgi:hypothetical protein
MAFRTLRKIREADVNGQRPTMFPARYFEAKAINFAQSDA